MRLRGSLLGVAPLLLLLALPRAALAGGSGRGRRSMPWPAPASCEQIYQYVEYCAAANVVQGYEDGLYHPERIVNRGQAAIYIARALVAPAGEEGVPAPPAGQQTFPDVTPQDDPTFFNHVEFLAGAGVVQGFWDGSYHPERPVRRDQMAAYIHRAFQLPL